MKRAELFHPQIFSDQEWVKDIKVTNDGKNHGASYEIT